MKIVIISDIHDNLVNLKKCLNWSAKNNVKEIICCGDVTNSETLNFLSKNFIGIINLVKGNMEIYDEKEICQYNNIKYYGRVGRIKISNQNIGLCHEPFLIEKVLKLGKCIIVFYGHTHKPFIEEKNKVKLINSGTLGGVFTKATFAIWDSKNGSIELKLLELL